MQDTLKKIGQSFFANFISILVSCITTFLVPKFFGIESYGYWQLYLFYTSYAGFLHWGMQDGLYLRYGGEQYNQINKKAIHTQWIAIIFLEIVTSIIIIVCSTSFITDTDKTFIWIAFSLNLVIYLPSTLLQFVLQATGEVKKYAYAILIERVMFGILIVYILLSGIFEYKYMIFVDLLSKLLALIYVIFTCRGIVISPGLPLKGGLKEIKTNFRVGILLLLANLSSMLILGISRFLIEKRWNIETFAKVSLPLSLCNFALVFITAISQVLFPILRRAKKEKLSYYYQQADKFSLIFLLGVLIFYYPAKQLLHIWLPDFSDSIYYLIFLLPLCVYESKSGLLLSTYYKTLRLEKKYFKINLLVVLLSTLFSVYSVFVLNNITVTLIIITVSAWLRCVTLEIGLKKHLRIHIHYSILLETITPTFFVILSVFFKGWLSTILYGAVYVITSYILFMSYKSKEGVLK